jgi:hypothetical protein
MRLVPVLSLLLCLTPVPLQAGQLIVTPSLAVQEEYNDNVFALTSGRRSDFLSTISPALAVSDSTERSSVNLAGGVSQLLYLRSSGSNGLGYFVRGSGSYTLSPRSTLNADLAGTRDSSASSIDPVTNLVTSSRTLHQNYRLGELYRVSELVSSSLSLGYGRDDYDNPAYLSTWHYSANSEVGFDLQRHFPGLQLTQSLGCSRDATSLSQVDSLSASLGLTKSINEGWRISLNGGGRTTHSRSRPAASTGWEAHDEAGALGRVSLAYLDDRISGNLTLSQDLISASGRSGSTQRTGGSLALSKKLTPRLSGNLGASYARNWSGQDQFGGTAIDERYRNLTGSLRYELFDTPSDLVLEGSYAYNNTDYHLLGTQMHQSIVMVRLTWQHSNFR